MTGRPLFRILLSLLLLLSQHMAFAHALSHVAGVLAPATASVRQPAGPDSELSSAIAQDKSCHQCLSFAQLAGPLATTPRAFAAPDLCQVPPAMAGTEVRCLRTVCAFRARAPPQT